MFVRRDQYNQHGHLMDPLSGTKSKIPHKKEHKISSQREQEERKILDSSDEEEEDIDDMDDDEDEQE